MRSQYCSLRGARRQKSTSLPDHAEFAMEFGYRLWSERNSDAAAPPSTDTSGLLAFVTRFDSDNEETTGDLGNGSVVYVEIMAWGNSRGWC